MINVIETPSKVDILAVGVHPDDIELSCVGTVLKHLKLGYSVGYCDLTKGEMGTRGSAPLRIEESRNAGNLVGVKFRVNLEMEDAFFSINKDSIGKIAEIIRLSKPKIILANAISDRHPDHGRASKLISDANFYSGLLKFEIGDTKPHRADAVYHYIQDRNIKPDFLVDISEFIEKKFESILCFGSQFFGSENEEPQTPISTQNFLEYMRAKNKSYGRDINVEYAEAYNVERMIGVNNLFDLS